MSIETTVVQASAVRASFMAFLARVGAERNHGRQAKTRRAQNPNP
jgi:hypothetical protein